jgi:hypothetical protein
MYLFFAPMKLLTFHKFYVNIEILLRFFLVCVIVILSDGINSTINHP